MKRLFTIAITVLLATAAFAQNQPDAEYNLIRRSYKLNSDGSMDIHLRKEIKLLRNRAITAYADKGETFITYNPAFESLKINECYTITADGKQVNTPANAFVRQLPSECADCGRLNGIREMAIVHTALEYNCTIVLDYTIHRNSSRLVERFNYSQDCPVKRFEVRYTDGHIDVYNNVPQTVNDPYMPEKQGFDVEFQLGTMPTYTTEVSLPAATYLLSQLRKNEPKEYIAAIRDWVVDYVHLNPVDLARVNYEMTPAAKVFSDNCGTYLDKTGLLAALLNEAGFRASIVNNSLNVFGDRPLEVEVLLDGKAYRLSATQKGAIITEQEKADARAIAEAPIYVDKTLEWQPDTIADEYVRITLPREQGGININPALLVPSRTSDVQSRATTEFYHYSMELPKNANLIGGDINIEKNFYNVGSLNIIIKQKGRRLLITRSLRLRQPVITKTDYAAFRELMNEWYQHQQLFFTVK